LVGQPVEPRRPHIRMRTETTNSTLARGRDAFRRKAWKDAYELLSAADAATPLGAEDLELLGTTAWLVGRGDAAASMAERSHREAIQAGDHARAARSAFWLGLNLIDRGEHAQASGWFARGERILDEAGADLVERGYLLLWVAATPKAISAPELLAPTTRTAPSAS
jgi:hypothetical protein